MTGEINSFRSRFFGGFNREDVVDYIAKLAQERNELEAAKIKAENDLNALTLEIEAIRSEADEMRRLVADEYERKISVFETAAAAFAGYEDSFSALCADISEAATGVFTAMQNAGDITARMSALLSQAVEKFEVLHSEFDAEKNEDEFEETHGKKYDDNEEDNVDID